MKIGTYYAEILGATTSEAGTGSLQIVVDMNVTHIMGDSGEWEDIESVERRLYMSLHDNAFQYTVDKLSRMGFNGDFSEPSFSEENAEVDMSMDTYNGKTSEKWELSGFGGGTVQKAADDKINRLNAKFRAETGTKAPPPQIKKN